MHKLTFYMKSGNNFVVDGIKSWDIDSNDGENRLKIVYSDNVTKRLIVPSVQLDQIEAILQEEE